MQAMECGGGGGRNKGLRHFALLVCNKIETKGRTTYNEVADELAEELKAEADAGGEESDKNIRRRVYDAFNVLLAVGIIAKEGKKEIVWKGFPGPKVRNVDELKRERQRRVQAVEQKQQELKELIEQHSMVKQLLEVNRVRSAEETDMALQIPFVIVRAEPEVTVEVSVSDNMKDVDFKFNAPFSLHDDSFVLKQVIQHYGSIPSSRDAAHRPPPRS